MNSMFDPKSYHLININGYPYMLHESILKKMNIFALLFDESFDQQNINLNIPDYDIKIVDDVFMKLFGQKINNSNHDTNIQKLKLMMYLGVNNDIIMEYAKEISVDRSIVDYIVDEFIAEKYHAYMEIILYNIKDYVVPNTVTTNLNKIKTTSYPYKLKFNFVNHLIYNSMSIYIDGNYRHKKYMYVVGCNNIIKYTSAYDQKIFYDAYEISDDDMLNFETMDHDYTQEEKRIKSRICKYITTVLLK